MSVLRKNELCFDLEALDHNLAEVRHHIGPRVDIIASVKANAYGHGIVPIAKRLAKGGVRILATGSIIDATAIRDADVDVDILLMGGVLPTAIPEVLALDLIPTIHNKELANSVLTSVSKPTKVYVKIDCGFGRLGVPLATAREFILELSQYPHVVIAGLYSHLPFNDAAGRDWAVQRIQMFERLIEDLAGSGVTIPITQVRASSAVMCGIKDSCTAISPGGLLYGTARFSGKKLSGWNLKPVLSSVRTCIIQVVDHPGGATLGYGAENARSVVRTGVVPFGLVDGNRRQQNNQRPYMLIDGHRAPVLSVSLEHAVLDLSDLPGVKVGQTVTFIGESGGEHISIADVAGWWMCTLNEVLMSLNRQIPSRYS